MPGNHGGYRFPLSSEPVRDGAQAIENLAWDVANHFPNQVSIQAGISGGVADANGAIDVPFPRAFSGNPSVTVTVRDAAIIAILHGPLQRPQGFTVLFKNLNGTNRPGAIEFSWIAAGPIT